jgi:hypothetical protein
MYWERNTVHDIISSVLKYVWGLEDKIVDVFPLKFFIEAAL